MSVDSVAYVSVTNVIIDDIVLWNGRTMMGTLGGSGTHAVMGMRIWHRGPHGLIAYLGHDLPPAMLQDLDRLGVDRRGLVYRNGLPTPRAWQLFEEDGQRTEIFRTSLAEFHQQQVEWEEFPQALRSAAGFHIQRGPTIRETIQLVERLRSVNPETCIVFEPLDDFLHLPPAEWRPLLHLCDAFLPNWDEAHILTHLASPRDMAQVLQTWGARHVVIRMGAKGIWVHGEDGDAWQIPAVPVPVVDVTGAGNAFCGGMLTGLGEGLGVLQASLRGVVSASFAIEQFGVPATLAHIQAQARQRFAWAAENAQGA